MDRGAPVNCQIWGLFKFGRNRPLSSSAPAFISTSSSSTPASSTVVKASPAMFEALPGKESGSSEVFESISEQPEPATEVYYYQGEDGYLYEVPVSADQGDANE